MMDYLFLSEFGKSHKLLKQKYLGNTAMKADYVVALRTAFINYEPNVPGCCFPQSDCGSCPFESWSGDWGDLRPQYLAPGRPPAHKPVNRLQQRHQTGAG